jgi:hypothetical protein
LVCQGFMQREGRYWFSWNFCSSCKVSMDQMFDGDRCLLRFKAGTKWMWWLHSLIVMLKQKSRSSFPKVLKLRRNSRKELLLFVCWKDFMVSSKLRDSGTMQTMQLCIVSNLLAVILTLVYA